VEAVTWGIPDAFGVFLEGKRHMRCSDSWTNVLTVISTAYQADPVFTSQRSAQTLLPLAGPVASGIMYCSGISVSLSQKRERDCSCSYEILGPVLYPWMNRSPNYRRPAIFVGLVICFASLLAASYTTRVRPLLPDTSLIGLMDYSNIVTILNCLARSNVRHWRM
jgi:MFS transporter, MCT family, solute carrier family 16 (monocarboxylic acid transporters), member 10